MKKLLALFGIKQKPKSRFKKFMDEARAMLNLARQDKAEGFHLASRAAFESAMSYRAAAHACKYYENKYGV